MRSNERDQRTQHHPPHIRSLIVRPPGSNDEDADRDTAAGDYEPGNASGEPPSFARSVRRRGDNGHRTRARSSSSASSSSASLHGSDLNHSGAPLRGGEFSSSRDAPGSGRHRDNSPPVATGVVAGGSPHGRGFDRRGPLETEDVSRIYNPKGQPRAGDWYCVDSLCMNLNFARRERCYKCKKDRYGAPANSPPPPPPRHPPLVNLSPRRDSNSHRSPPRHPPLMNLSPRRDSNSHRSPPRHPPLMNLSPRRDSNSHRSPPHGWPRDSPPPPPRHDHPTWRDRDRERDNRRYSDKDYPPSRRTASNWVHNEPNPKPHYERRPPPSPPPPPPRGDRWGQRLSRERSKSPRHDHPTMRDRDRERDNRHYSDKDYPPRRRTSSNLLYNEPNPKPHYERRPPPPPPPPPPRGDSRGRRLSRERSRSPRHDRPTWRDRDRDRDNRHYSDKDYPPSRRTTSNWVHNEPNPKPHYERRPPPPTPPPPPPPRGDRWGRRLSRERSRSPPMRSGPPPPPRDYRRDSYYERGGREDRRGRH